MPKTSCGLYGMCQGICGVSMEAYYNAEADNFFCVRCMTSMGQEFYDKNIGKVKEAIEPKKEDYGKSKYHRTIWSCVDPAARPITVDVYSVLLAFNVTCPARAHATKKLLCAGIRGKGGALKDLKEAAVALQRAIEEEERNEQNMADR